MCCDDLARAHASLGLPEQAHALQAQVDRLSALRRDDREAYEEEIRSLRLRPVAEEFYAGVQKVPMDLDLHTKFLAALSSLLLKKAMVLVPDESAEGDGEDELEFPSEDLLSHLFEFRRYQEAALHLSERADEMRRRIPRIPPEVQEWHQTLSDLEGANLVDLVSALERVLQRDEDTAYQTISREPVSVAECMDRIRHSLETAGGRVAFVELFPRGGGKRLLVSIFIALLELIRQSEIRVDQESRFGEILVYQTSK